ncbi:hypothetical protein [Frankia sp. Cas3]|uniref:hypothetical protein n=1 Tax=Frankia sp. Cas3 TaxID=3073926 RepID=UPI002AD29309|nr:hypothetical protein [Frankia sp. Cas3]
MTVTTMTVTTMTVTTMTRTPAHRLVPDPDGPGSGDGEPDRPEPGGSAGDTVRDSRRPGLAGHGHRLSRCRRGRRGAVGLLAVGLAAGPLVALGWVHPDDVAAQILSQLLVVAGAAAVTRSRPPR